MHISHDFIATKTCCSYEFLVVFGQVWVWDRKSAGRARAKFLKLLRVRGGFKFCGCGAGADRKFQPAQDSAPGSHLRNPAVPRNPGWKTLRWNL